MKLACCFGLEGERSRAVAEKMADAQRSCDWHRCERVSAGAGAAALVLTSDQNSPVPLLHRGDIGNWLAVAGTPVDLAGDIRSRLASAAEGDAASAARLLTGLDGPFAAVMWDQAAGKCLIVTDFLGMQPLYIARADGAMLLASEVRGIAASGLVDLRLDPAGWGSFVAFGHIIAGVCQLAGVRRAPPAAAIVYDPADGATETATYWHWPAPRPELAAADVDTAALVAACNQEIARYRQYADGGTVLLSGGYDSRFVLAMLRQADADVSALVLSHADHFFGADGRYALKAAKALGVREVNFIDPPPGFYDTGKYLAYVQANEAATKSLGLFIAQLSAHVRPEMRSVWDGCFPGAILPPLHHLVVGGFEEYLTQECRRHRGDRPWRAAKMVFAPETFEAMHAGFTELLRSEMGRYADDGFGVAEFFVRNRTRHRIATNPLKVYANKVLAFTPGLTRAFFEVAGEVSLLAKADNAAYRLMLRRHLPRAMEAPFLAGDRLMGNRAISPGVWATSAAYTALHYWRRARLLPAVGPAIRRVDNCLRRRPAQLTWPLADAVVNQIDEAHGDLNAASVAALKAAQPPYDRVIAAARELLFYWQTWRWVMEGKLTADRAGNLAAELLG